jgi:hypothetical protein
MISFGEKRSSDGKQTRVIDSESVAAGAGSGFDEMMRFGQVDEIKKKNARG